MAGLEPKYEQFHRLLQNIKWLELNLNMNSITEYTIQNIEWLDLNLNKNSITEYTIQNMAGLEPKYEQYHRVYNAEHGWT